MAKTSNTAASHSKPAAVKRNSSAKIHGDELASAIPEPDNGGHSRSAAAHLGGTVHDHTKPAGNLRHGAAPGELREPPMVVERVGKQHR